MPLVDVRDLVLEFGGVSQPVRALDGITLAIERGETLCLVGESGSGKSVLGLSLARLLPSPPARYISGEILVNGRNVFAMGKHELRAIRGRTISYVFQEPGAVLNPVIRLGDQVKESLALHRPSAATDAEVIRLFQLVGIAAPEIRMRQYPHQISGGMQQRVVIAMAIASEPQLLVADEPTTALDVTVQAQILDLLRDLKRKLGMSLLLITHHLGIVSGVADRVAVMYAGQIVESGPSGGVLKHPSHPYTRGLLQSIPRLGGSGERLRAIRGSVPASGAMPSGCRFHPRCEQAQDSCSRQSPELIEVETNRWVRCPYWDRI